MRGSKSFPFGLRPLSKDLLPPTDPPSLIICRLLIFCKKLHVAIAISEKLINDNNDITIAEINETLKLNVSDEAIRQHVVNLGFRYKKKSVHAAERDRARCSSKEK